MKKHLFAVILSCFPLLLAAQEKVQFEGTIRIHQQQENLIVKRQQQEVQKQLEQYASSQKGFGDKMIAKAVMKSSLEQVNRTLAQSEGADGEFDIIKKVKGNKIIEFIPTLGKITIYDGDATNKIEVYTKYKVAVKSPFLTEISKIYKIQNPELKDTIRINGIVCTKNEEQNILINGQNTTIPESYMSAYYENFIVHSSSSSPDFIIATDVTDIIEESIPDSIFEVPSKYKFVEQTDVVKLQMKDKKGIKTSYKFGDPIPADFWNFK